MDSSAERATSCLGHLVGMVLMTFQIMLGFGRDRAFEVQLSIALLCAAMEIALRCLDRICVRFSQARDHLQCSRCSHTKRPFHLQHTSLQALRLRHTGALRQSGNNWRQQSGEGTDDGEFRQARRPG